MFRPSFRLLSALLIGVAASTSVSNIMTFSSTAQNGQSVQQCYNSCDDEKLNLQTANEENGYMNTETNATTGAGTDSPKELQQRSRTYTALILLLWYLAFANLQLHQLALFMMFLVVTGSDTNVMFSCPVAGLSYYLLTKMYGSNDDHISGTSTDDAFYYDVEETPLFSLTLGCRTFVWVMRVPTNY